MHRYGPDPYELAFLASTIPLPWDMIWLQRGAITEDRSPRPGVYEVSQITFGREALLWVSADADDVDGVPPFREVFFIAVQHDERYGDLRHEERWRPRRADPVRLPADISFEPFRPPGRQYALVTIQVDVIGGEPVLVDHGLLVTAMSGERLLFYCDTEAPLDMFITMDAAVIDEHLEAATELHRVEAEA